jgi:hypothetical protein
MPQHSPTPLIVGLEQKVTSEAFTRGLSSLAERVSAIVDRYLPMRRKLTSSPGQEPRVRHSGRLSLPERPRLHV